MARWRIVGTVLAALLTALGVSGIGTAARTFLEPCSPTAVVECGSVSVPLDRSGRVPGTVSLAVQELPADGPAQGVMFLLAGGPGQSATLVFDLARYKSYWRSAYPGWTLVVFDVRGTGGSTAIDLSKVATLPFYGTRQNADDLDAVRQALGIDKVVVNGTSYGTQFALAYAADYPDHVQSLILDSTVPPTGHDPLDLNVLQSMPAGLAAMCPGTVCAAATSDFPGQVVQEANALAKAPLIGGVQLGSGRGLGFITGVEFLDVVLSADLNPGIQAELPAAVAAARRGFKTPLLRLFFLDQLGSVDPSFSSNVYLATRCDDGPFPWSPSTPQKQRQRALDNAVAALPAAATAPFGSWATALGGAAFCLGWPTATGAGAIDTSRFPDVPVLILSGDQDLRTPTADARAVAAFFPQSHVVVVHGIGHSVQSADLSGCALAAVRTFLGGGTPVAECPYVPPYVEPLGKLASTASGLFDGPPPASRRTRTLKAAVATVNEATAAADATAYGISRYGVPGMAGGQLYGKGRNGFTIELVHYALVSGIEVDGWIRLARGNGLTLQPAGTVTVRGRFAAPASITFGPAGIRVRWTHG